MSCRNLFMRYLVFVFVLCLTVFEYLVASGMCESDFKFSVQSSAHHDIVRVHSFLAVAPYTPSHLPWQRSSYYMRTEVVRPWKWRDREDDDVRDIDTVRECLLMRCGRSISPRTLEPGARIQLSRFQLAVTRQPPGYFT